MSARKLLPELPGLKEWLDPGGVILKVGCGTDRHFVRLTKTFQQARCVGVGIDPTDMKAARAAVENGSLVDHVDLIDADVITAMSEGSFETVVMVEVLHEIAPGFRKGVIDACHLALAADGWLMIIDEIYPVTLAESRRAEFLFPVQTGFGKLTWGNVVPTRDVQESLLRSAGFTGHIGRSIEGEGFTGFTAQR